MTSSIQSFVASIAIFVAATFAQNEMTGIRPGSNPGEFIVSAEKLKSLMMSIENKDDTISMLQAKIHIQDSLASHYEAAITSGARYILSLDTLVLKQDSLYHGYKDLYHDLSAITWPTPPQWSLIPGAGLIWNKDRIEPIGQLSVFHHGIGFGFLMAPSLYGGIVQYKFHW